MQRYFTKTRKDNQFILSKEDMYHIKVVMRMKDNDSIEVVYENKVYICNLYKDTILMEKEEITNYSKKIYTILCIPLLQEQKMSFVLQKATELGIDEIIPILTSRSIVKLENKQDKKLERWNRIVKEASEQSKRITIPKIREVQKISDLHLEGLKIICSTIEKENTFKKVLKNNSKCDKIIMVVGPEGGLSISEEQILKGIGFIPVTLGQNIMRVETVPIYLLSVLNYEMME